MKENNFFNSMRVLIILNIEPGTFSAFGWALFIGASIWLLNIFLNVFFKGIAKLYITKIKEYFKKFLTKKIEKQDEN